MEKIRGCNVHLRRSASALQGTLRARALFLLQEYGTAARRRERHDSGGRIVRRTPP